MHQIGWFQNCYYIFLTKNCNKNNPSFIEPPVYKYIQHFQLKRDLPIHLTPFLNYDDAAQPCCKILVNLFTRRKANKSSFSHCTFKGNNGTEVFRPGIQNYKTLKNIMFTAWFYTSLFIIQLKVHLQIAIFQIKCTETF